MPDSRGRDVLKQSSELLVLSLLADEPKYGYAIIKQVATRSEGAIRLTPGVLYPLLHRMEGQGLLKSTWETVQAERNDQEGTGRKRKWYRLSAKGRRRLDQKVAAHRACQALLETFIHPLEGEGAG